LDLTFADGFDVASQIGRTIDLFDWPTDESSPSGQFVVTSPYSWDLTNLYTTGEITLTGVPEPAFVTLLGMVGALMVSDRCRRISGKGRCRNGGLRDRVHD
jgi:hypothetical protein